MRTHVKFWLALLGQVVAGGLTELYAAPTARYVCEAEAGARASFVTSFTIGWGPVERRREIEYRWLTIEGAKAGGQKYRVWLLTRGYPDADLKEAGEEVARYLFQEGASEPVEFRNRHSGRALMPGLGAWPYLLPRGAGWTSAGDGADLPMRADYLGHSYRREGTADESGATSVPSARVIELSPDVLVGVPSNTRQRDDHRRYDGSEYEYVPLTRQDYEEMSAAGLNCFRVDAAQLEWVKALPAFYWGIDVPELRYPQCLYDSRYLGPVLFLDEPGVATRDHVIRPRLAAEAGFRKAITPEIVFDSFREYFRHSLDEGAPVRLIKGLAARADVDLGTMRFKQENLYTWDTLVSTAAWQLSQESTVPMAIVFEPPGRIGTRRTLPELNMTYGCQLPTDVPNYFIEIIYGFLRGAARWTGKEWGTSIYGAVDRSDAAWFLTRAYDLGATRFFFWDNAQLACVPYGECLALARAIKMQVENQPQRDLAKLKHAAEVAILLPPGYNLGHVHLGKGSLWGVGELNLERTNRVGVKYREVMSAFFIEIERCLRLGIAFDLLWDLPGIRLPGYREIIRVREDATIEFSEKGGPWIAAKPRVPNRPPGDPPQLTVHLPSKVPKGMIKAHATVTETSAPVYYTYGTDTDGVYQNARVAWELYGPGEEDYRFLTPAGLKPRLATQGARSEIEIEFSVNRPGQYRLRVGTVDRAGRSRVVWAPFSVE